MPMTSSSGPTAQPGSQLAINAPKEEKDAPPIARMFYVAYFKKDAKPEDSLVAGKEH